MFVDVKQLQDGSPRGRLGTDQGEPLSGMASLAALYKSLLAAFKEEALVLGHVFPSSPPALTLFVQRVFEQKVQVLPLPPPYVLTPFFECDWIRTCE